MKSQSIALYFLIFIGWLIPSGFADWRDIDYPPSQHPNFSLLESSSSHVRIQYQDPKSDPLYRSNEIIYVGIPIEATYELKILDWDFSYFKNREFSYRATSSNVKQATLNEHKEMVEKAITVNRNAYQELDILKLEIDTPVSIRSTGTSTYKQDKVSIDRIEFEISWQGATDNHSSQSGSNDLGYGKIFENLCINYDESLDLRRKRTLKEEDISFGFHPFSVGYHESDKPLNAAQGPVLPRAKALRINVRQTGMRAIRFEEMKDFNVDLAALDVQHIRLWNQGTEQPIYIKEDGNGIFDNADTIFFYGQAPDSEYTQDSPYYLTWVPADIPPKRISASALSWQEEGSESTLFRATYDEDTMLGREGYEHYKWFYSSLDEKSKMYPLPFDTLAPEGEIVVTLSLRNNTNKQWEFDAIIGHATATASLQINSSTMVRFTFPAEQAQSAENLIIESHQKPVEISMIERSMSDKMGNEDFVFVDKIEVVYPAVLNMATGPYQIERSLLSKSTKGLKLSMPTTEEDNNQENNDDLAAWVIDENNGIQRLHGSFESGTFISIPDGQWDVLEIDFDRNVESVHSISLDYPSSLHRTDQGYDYIIVSHRLFMDGVRRLSQRRLEDGFNVLQVDVQDIYDEFNYGYPHIDAIKRFLRYTQSEWDGLSAEFVTLVGDSCWDHRDRLGHGVVDQIPTEAPDTNPQRYGSDEWYAYLWGGERDYMSDAIVGRISVRVPDELNDYLDKIETYEDNAPVGLWKTKNTFISDDKFERYSVEQTKRSLPAVFKPEFINQIDFPHVTNPYLYHRNVGNPDPKAEEYLNKKYCPQGTLAIIDSFDRGTSVVQYIGHGGNQLWSHERLFYGTDKIYSNVLELEPNNKFPFIMNWSCKTGYLNFHISPFNVCLAEEFMRHPEKGGIAVWAPSGEGTTDEHVQMSHLFMRNMFQNGMDSVGEAITFAKNEYMQSRNSKDLVNQYILFGDPALQLTKPKEKVDMTIQPDFFVPGFEHEFILETDITTFSKGQAVVSINIADTFLYESEPFEFDNGHIEHSILTTINEKVDDSTAYIRIYAWNEDENVDAWGGMSIPQLKPIVELNKGDSTASGNQTTLEFEVQNLSGFGIYDMQCDIHLGEDVQSHTIESIPPNATTKTTWTGVIPKEIAYAVITIPAQPSQGIEALNTEKRLVIPVEREQTLTAEPLLPNIEFSPEELTAGKSIRTMIPFVNFSKINNATFHAAIAGPGAATAEKIITIPPEEDRRLDFPIQLPEAGNYEYTLTISNDTTEKSYIIPLEVLGKPDLALSESEITVEPEIPVIGKTVYIKANVWNMGLGPATDVAIEAYDGDRSLNQRLTPFNEPYRRVIISRLEPGESKEVTFRWDPPSYDGLGYHDINFIVDPYDKIEESGEENNQVRHTISLHNLPDLQVDNWRDHYMRLEAKTGIPEWGQPGELKAKVQNVGESDAEYVRVSMIYNEDELTGFIDEIPKGAKRETSFDIPVYSARNSMLVVADKYDLIGEKDETNDLGNNISKAKLLYLQLRMPEAPIENNRREYHIESENQFAAGLGEFTYFDPSTKELFLQSNMEEAIIRIEPAYVDNKQSFSYSTFSRNKWAWNIKYNAFYSPTQSESLLRTELPAPNGNYEVYLQLYSNAYNNNASGEIYIKTQFDKDFRLIKHGKPDDPKAFRKIGEYEITDDTFMLDFRAVPGKYSTSLGDIRFVRSEKDAPSSCGYLSPYFPAAGSGSGPAVMTWDATIPEGTDLTVKARWVNRKNKTDGSVSYLPWARKFDGKDGKLILPGKGDFFQYYVSFVRETRDTRTPTFSNVKISIPCQEAKKKIKIGPAR